LETKHNLFFFLATENSTNHKVGNLLLTEIQTTILNKIKQPCRKYSTEEFQNCSKAAILENFIPQTSCISYNIREFVDFSEVNLEECISEETAASALNNLSLIIDDYISRTSEFGCPVSCKQKSFNYKLEYFSKNSWITLEEEYRVDNDIFVLFVSFESLYVEEKTETFVYDIGSFLTAAGGNLGLFMGFSCLSIMVAFIDCLKNHFRNHFDQK
jgi:hypothetical protein